MTVRLPRKAHGPLRGEMAVYLDGDSYPGDGVYVLSESGSVRIERKGVA